MLSAEDNALLTRTGPDTPMGRTREHLGPTDLAVIQFRRLALGEARALHEGIEPAATQASAAYAVRSGSAMARRGTPFPDGMVARFGDPVGRAPRSTPPAP